MENQLKKEIEYRYSALRKKATAKSEYYKGVLLSDADYVRALNELNSYKFEFSKAKYDNDVGGEKLYLEKIDAAKKKLNSIAKKLGVDSDALKPDYACPACKDSGFTLDGNRCVCYNKILKEVVAESLGISAKPLPSFSQSEFENKNGLAKLYAKIKVYCSKFGLNSKNLIISGKVGTGKTFLAGCIANEIEKSGFSTLFLTANELNSVFIKYHTAPIDEKSYYLRLLGDCDLLIIDDLGSEPVYKNVTTEYLLMVLCERASKNAPTVITTNLSQDQLFDRYNERVTSRINDKRRGVFLQIQGEDLRHIK